METIIACPRGHRYRVFALSRNNVTTCPRCDLAELIALAYGDCQKPPRSCRLLNFRSEPIQDFQVLSEVLSLIGPYNRFRPTAVLRELGPLFPKLSAIEIGRESSPVLYARVPYWTHQAIQWTGTGMGVQIAAGERNALGNGFLKAMERAEADSLSDDGRAFRAWWD